MTPLEELKRISPREATEIVLSWYPWWSREEVYDFLITRTTWPFISNDELKRSMLIAHLKVWNQYVKIADKFGYEVKEKPLL